LNPVIQAHPVGVPFAPRGRTFRITGNGGGADGVYAAVDDQGRPATLTLVGPDTSEAPGFGRRFRRLARARERVVHRNLLEILGWGKSEYGFYLAIRRHAGPTLAAMLRNGPLDLATSIRLLAGVAEGLTAAHSVGLVARALTPAEIGIEDRDGGVPVLGDLGITKPLHPGLWLILGEAVNYVSPEELRDEPPVPQSNVYSLACILCECLTGLPPYPSGLRVAVPYAHLTAERPALTRRRPELPSGIDDIVATAMAPEARDRYAGPIAFIRAAAGAVGESIDLPRPGRLHAAPAPAPRPAPPRDTLPRTVPAVIALLAVAAALVGHAVGARESPPNREVRPRAAAVPEIERLNAARLAARRQLAASRRRSAQAALAQGLATLYARTGVDLARGPASPAVRAAVQGAGRAYAALATAARRGDRVVYVTAGAWVVAAERRLDRALAAASASRGREPDSIR
jgi:Protein kinase domain